MLAVVALGVVFLTPPRQPPVTELSVNGVALGMTLEEAQLALGPSFRTIQIEEFRFELRGEGEFPVSVILELEPIYDEALKTFFAPTSCPISAITGTNLCDTDGTSLVAGDRDSLAGWVERHSKFERKGPNRVWGFPDSTAWANFGTPAGDVPLTVGLHSGEWPESWNGEHSRPWPLPPPDSTLPVREPGLLNGASVRLAGIHIGMMEREVLRVLGQPDRTGTDKDTGRSFLGYSSVSGSRISVGLQHGAVAFVGGEGPLSLNGRRVAVFRGGFKDLLKAFKRVDATHKRGFSGGTSVYCWAETDLVVEVSTYGDTATIGEVSIVDPRQVESAHSPPY